MPAWRYHRRDGTEVSSANIGEKVTVMGWVQKRRNLGSLIFIDLRDRSGLLQIVFHDLAYLTFPMVPDLISSIALITFGNDLR